MSNYHLRHNQDLLHHLKDIIPGNDKFISFDVTALFTNVPLGPTLDFLKRKLPSVNFDFGIPINCLVELIELCTKNSYFQYGKEFYEQVFGMAMGNPLSPVLAGLFLEHVETEILPLYTGVQPKLWLRYVDDSLSRVSTDFDLNGFLHFLNSLYPTLKFTYEWEYEGKIPFLDVLIFNLKSCLKFSVYRKPTNAESYLHFFSFTAENIKVGLAQCLFLRALRVCSPEYLKDEIDHIKFALKKLAYPERILDKAYWKARKTAFRNVSDKEIEPMTQDNVIPVRNIVVPYVPTLEKFKGPLKQINYGLVFKYNNKISNCLTSNSPPIPGGVYKIPCKVCPKLYIGETGRTLQDRIGEHKSDIVKPERKLSSGVVSHVWDTGHLFDFTKAEMLFNSNDLTKRHLVESAVIKHYSHQDLSLNLNYGFSPHNNVLSKHITQLIPSSKLN